VELESGDTMSGRIAARNTSFMGVTFYFASIRKAAFQRRER
jgi:hypothetical protein